MSIRITTHHHRDTSLFAGKGFSLDESANLQKKSGKHIVDGIARRVTLNSGEPMAQLAAVKLGLAGGYITAGVYRDDLPDETNLTLSGRQTKDAIARTNADLPWAVGKPGIWTSDYDGGPAQTREELKQVLESRAPGITQGALLLMESSSAGLAKIGEEELLRPTNRWHLHVPVVDASDIPRATEAMHVRLFLDGHGWHLISTDGRILPRSPFDKMLAVPCQPIYGPPKLGEGLERRVPPPEVVEGALFDTRTIPNLTAEERQAFDQAVADMKARVEITEADTLAKRRKAVVKRVAKQMGIPEDAAARELKRREGNASVLVGGFQVLLDSGEWVSVNDILRDREKYHRTRCHDPLEPEYGPGHALIYTDDNPTPLIHSLAHGLGSRYLLRLDVPGMVGVLRNLASDERDQVWATLAVALMVKGKLPHEQLAQAMKDEVRPTGIQATRRALKEAKADQAAIGARERAKAEELAMKRRATVERKVLVTWDPVNLNPIIRKAQNVIGADPVLQFADTLVTVEEGVPSYVEMPDGSEPPPILKFKQLKERGLRQVLEYKLVFVTETPLGAMQIPVPLDLCREMLQAQNLGVPHVVGILEHPIVRHDGTILAASGYDADSRLFLAADMPEALPTELSLHAAEAALDWLREVYLADFPWASELDEDVAVGQLLTGLQRLMLPAAPGALIDAPVRSAGKTAKAQADQVTLTGRLIPASTLPEQEEEIEKRLTAFLLEGRSAVLFDNVRDGRSLESESLAALSTGEGGFMGRVLGESRNMQSAGRVSVYLTGVNVKTSGDFNTRMLTARLEPGVERPDMKKFPRDLKTWALEHRAETLRACLTIVAGYYAAGCPVGADWQDGGRFPAWNKMVRFPLLWAGACDIAESFATNTDDDPTYATETWLLECLHDWQEAYNSGEPWLASAVAPTEKGGGLGPYKDIVQLRNIRSAWQELHPKTDFLAGNLARMYLRKREGDVRNGLVVKCHGKTKRGTFWQVVRRGGR